MVNKIVVFMYRVSPKIRTYNIPIGFNDTKECVKKKVCVSTYRSILTHIFAYCNTIADKKTNKVVPIRWSAYMVFLYKINKDK